MQYMQYINHILKIIYDTETESKSVALKNWNPCRQDQWSRGSVTAGSNHCILSGPHLWINELRWWMEASRKICVTWIIFWSLSVSGAGSRKNISLHDPSDWSVSHQLIPNNWVEILFGRFSSPKKMPISPLHPSVKLWNPIVIHQPTMISGFYPHSWRFIAAFTTWSPQKNIEHHLGIPPAFVGLITIFLLVVNLTPATRSIQPCTGDPSVVVQSVPFGSKLHLSKMKQPTSWRKNLKKYLECEEQKCFVDDLGKMYLLSPSCWTLHLEILRLRLQKLNTCHQGSGLSGPWGWNGCWLPHGP